MFLRRRKGRGIWRHSGTPAGRVGGAQTHWAVDADHPFIRERVQAAMTDDGTFALQADS
jgi:hypothetical protein